MDELIIDDPNIIINNFIDFFANIDTKLAQTYGKTDFNTIAKFLSKRVGSFMCFIPPSPTETFDVINALGALKGFWL